MSKKYIIGGGISGLVFQMYHPEYTIITPDVGGLFANAYIATVHDTSEVRHFLRDIGYENVEKLAKKDYLGYYHRGWIKEILSPELNLLMIQKKMADWNKPIDVDFIPESLDMSTSRSANYMKALDVDPGEIIERLKEKSGTILEGKVTAIDDVSIRYLDSNATEQVLSYDSLVSTVAAPIFWKLYGTPKEFKFNPITNVITDKRPELFHDKFHIIYYDDTVPFSRITHLQDKYCIELTGVLTQEETSTVLPTTEVLKHFTVPFGRISNTSDNEPPNSNITFLGRFAQWKYGITLEHVIKRTLEYK